MKSKYHFLFIVCIYLIIPSCSDPGDCFKGTGKIEEEERTLDAFKAVHFSDNVEIVFTNDSGSTVRVSAGKHIISKIKTKVTDGYLYITNENDCNWVRSYKKEIKVYIGIQNVKDVFNYGNANIESEWLTKDTLFFHHYGSGDVHLKMNSNRLWMDMDKLGDFTIEGTIKNMNAHVISLGELKAESLKVENIYLINEGQANCYVTATNVLGVTIKNSGNVYYTGLPTSIYLDKTGSGNLIKQ